MMSDEIIDLTGEEPSTIRVNTGGIDCTYLESNPCPCPSCSGRNSQGAENRSTQSSQVSTGPNWGDCPICLDSLSKKEILSTECGHVFCSLCLNTWIKSSNQCPMCRRYLATRNIHPIYRG